MAKLTKSLVEKLPLPSKGSYALYWDERDRGFGVRVTAEGKRTYVVQGRVCGKELRVTIGPHGVFTVDQARNAARELLRNMRMGVDPREARKEARAAGVSLRQVADAYLRDRQLKPSTKAEIERHVTTTFAAWVHRPLCRVSREDVTKRFHEMKTKGLRGKAPAPAQANQAFAILRALFNYAIREYRKSDGTPLLPDNPVDVLYKKWAALRPRTSRIPESKIGAVWAFLQTRRASTAYPEAQTCADLVMFLLLTGARISEATELTWDRVDLNEHWWHLPDPKNANPVWLPLSSPARALLAGRRPQCDGYFVFPSGGESGHIRDPRDTLRHVSLIAGTHITPHDLRRTFTTIGVATCGIDLYKVELLTNHVPKTVTERHYLETSKLSYLMPEIERIGEWVIAQASRVDGAGLSSVRLTA